jgi:hypothetical protein
MRICAISRLCCAAVAVWSVATAGGALAADVVMVEEHWSVKVGGPEPERCAPQVSMLMSPIADTEGDHFVVTINHHGMPNFCAGGLEVQHWKGSDFLRAKQLASNEKLHHDGETVSWVQRLSLPADSNTLSFEVVEGSSETWGAFGASGSLKLQVQTAVSRLNDYKPAVSLTESGIGYAGNRVSSLVLNKLVWWTDDGQRHELVAPIDIDTDLDP